MPLSTVLMIPDLIGAAQGYFVAFILFRLKRGSHQANSLLAALVLVVSVMLSFSPILIPSVYTAFPFFIRIAEPMRFLIAPLLFLYVRAQTGGQVNRRSLLHFTPFVVYVVFLMITFYFQPAEEKIKFLTENLAGKSQSYNIFLLARSLHFFAYLLLSIRLLRDYSLRIRNEYSSIERINLHWLRNLIAAMWLWWAIQFVAHIGMLLGFSGLRSLNLLVGLLGTLWMYLLAYVAIMKADSFVQTASIQELPTILSQNGVQFDEQHNGARYYDAPLSEQYESESHTSESNGNEPNILPNTLLQERQEGMALLEHLQYFMETKQPFLDSELTLQKLAGQVGIPAYRLSQIINMHLHKNFFDVVNQYRVEEIKRRMLSPKYNNYTVSMVAIETGFNSKSAFNAAFKKHTGMTPSEFKKQHESSTMLEKS